MKRRILLALTVALTIPSAALLAQQASRWKAILGGLEEPPPISTVGSGEFHAQINLDETAIAYELSYDNLEGQVAQAHIHFGQPGVNGGISVFLCTNLGNGPAGTQPCPSSPATISGTITAADVIGPTGQGIAPAEFAELINAIRNESAYANVHSSKFPGGEIRGQIRP